MNRMEMIPHNTTSFCFTRNCERLGRCAFLLTQQERLADCVTETEAAATLTDDDRSDRLSYLRALRHKVAQAHQEAHQCYPFSIN